MPTAIPALTMTTVSRRATEGLARRDGLEERFVITNAAS
jgi:hypothetical protein